MVLVDTSIWIRFLSNRLDSADELTYLLTEDRVIGHPLVFGELLMGDIGGRTRFLEAYEKITQSKIVRHEEVVDFVRSRGLHGRGIGWIDVHLLASAVVEAVQFWTADPRLETLARELGMSFDSS